MHKSRRPPPSIGTGEIFRNSKQSLRTIAPAVTTDVPIEKRSRSAARGFDLFWFDIFVVVLIYFLIT